MISGNTARPLQLIAAVFVLLSLLPLTVTAGGPIGLGTSQQGTLTYNLGSAIARTLFKNTDIRATVQPNTGTGVMIPLIANGELDFGFSNVIELDNALQGRGVFKGRSEPNLRLVARLFPAQVGLLVRADSDIYTIKDLRGARLTTGYQSTPVLHDLIKAMLASEGLSIDDITQIPVPSLIRGAEAFVAGRADVTFFAAGVAKVSEINVSVEGVRFISLSAKEQDIKRMQSIVPRTYITSLEPRPGLAGITKPTNLMTYDYSVFARADLSEHLVYRVIEAIVENRETLIKSFSIFRRMNTAEIAMDLGIEYHTGAIKYYKDQNLWTKRY